MPVVKPACLPASGSLSAGSPCEAFGAQITSIAGQPVSDAFEVQYSDEYTVDESTGVVTHIQRVSGKVPGGSITGGWGSVSGSFGSVEGFITGKTIRSSKAEQGAYTEFDCYSKELIYPTGSSSAAAASRGLASSDPLAS